MHVRACNSIGCGPWSARSIGDDEPGTAPKVDVDSRKDGSAVGQPNCNTPSCAWVFTTATGLNPADLHGHLPRIQQGATRPRPRTADGNGRLTDRSCYFGYPVRAVLDDRRRATNPNTASGATEAPTPIIEGPSMRPATDQQAEWFSHWFNALLDNVEQVIKGKRDQIAPRPRLPVRRGPPAARGRARHRQDDAGQGDRRLGDGHVAAASSSRPTCCRPTSPAVSVYNQAHGTFEFRPGPVFANIVLADEINRASPKTQSALLEVMEERHVTVDGAGYAVPRPFVVIATQNPIEQEGTYRLPEAQLDRFLMRTTLGYPDHDHEVDVLRMLADELRPESLQPVMSTSDVRTMIQVAEAVHVDDSIHELRRARCARRPAACRSCASGCRPAGRWRSCAPRGRSPPPRAGRS